MPTWILTIVMEGIIVFHIDILGPMATEVNIKEMGDTMNTKDMDIDKFPHSDELEYEHILAYLETGREIEFIYQGKEYIIAYGGEDGRTVWMGITKVSESYGDRHKDLLNNFKLNGIPLAELFQSNEVKITYIL